MKLSSNHDYSDKSRGVIDDCSNLPASLTSKKCSIILGLQIFANTIRYNILSSITLDDVVLSHGCFSSVALEPHIDWLG